MLAAADADLAEDELKSTVLDGKYVQYAGMLLRWEGFVHHTTDLQPIPSSQELRVHVQLPLEAT